MTAKKQSESQSQIVFLPAGNRGEVETGTSVLDAANSLGVGIESICGGVQTCGKCLVELQVGVFEKHGINSLETNLSEPEGEELAYAEAHGLDLNNQRLSCAARILGDAVIHIPESSRARKQVVRKEASELELEVKPAIRLIYAEVEPAELGMDSDATRLRQALEVQFNLKELSIDPTILKELQPVLREGQWKLTATVYKDSEVIRVKAGYDEAIYGLAVDVGTTTIAGYLCDLRTGDLISTAAIMNPQIKFGEDLMSRISYSMREPQGLHRMQRAVVHALNELAEQAAQQAGINSSDVCDMVVVGNSVMHHILLGIDPTELGRAPFALAIQEAIDIKARDLNLSAVHPGTWIHILPCIAGHVGADNVGVLLAELPHLDESTSLIVDIGTNAEILLGTADTISSASSPTGPAFEGAQITHGQRAAPGAIERLRIDENTGHVRYRVIGDERWSDELSDGESLQPTGICGSGIIEVVAELFRVGWIDSGGLFVDDLQPAPDALRFSSRTGEVILASAEDSATGQEIVVTQNDIRAIQLAKGALYAGVKVLLDKLDIEQVDSIKLAGAFGSYIDPKYAMIIGMIPDCDLTKVRSIGNAAGDGARIALLNIDQRITAQTAARSVRYIETALDPSFQTLFVGAMTLPHANDEFPQLSGILPERTAPDRASARNRKRRRSEKNQRNAE